MFETRPSRKRARRRVALRHTARRHASWRPAARRAPRSAFPRRAAGVAGPRRRPAFHPVPTAVLLALFPLALALNVWARRNSGTVEALYSRRIYHALVFPVSRWFALAPFSAAEWMVYAAAAFALLALGASVRHLAHRRFLPPLRLLLALLCIASAGYFVFTAGWGLNYSREPLARNLGYREGQPTEAELAAVMRREQADVASAAGELTVRDGRTVYPGGFARMRAQVDAGYRALAARGGIYRALFSGARPWPKAILASPLLSYTGIDGIYFPFTGEPNVNTADLPFTQPFDAAHESAHFKGFAREDEANFIAYLADSANPDPYFRYSAHMEAYLYVSNALYATDYKAWAKLDAGLSPVAREDFAAYNRYYDEHQGKAQELSNNVNNSYLQAQGQQGVITYDMFVNLLCDEFRSGK